MLTDQDIFKAFDFEATDDEPYLTVAEISAALAEHLGVEASDEAVQEQLGAMLDASDVERKERNGTEVYRALVGPRLAPDVAARSDERRKLLDRTEDDEYVPLDDLA